MIKRQQITFTQAWLSVKMPEDKPFCQFCYALEYDRARDLRFCKATGETVIHYKSGRGFDCPLLIAEKNKEENKEEVADDTNC